MCGCVEENKFHMGNVCRDLIMLMIENEQDGLLVLVLVSKVLDSFDCFYELYNYGFVMNHS